MFSTLFVLAILANSLQAQTNTPKTFVTNTMVGKKFVWEKVTEVGTTNVTIRRVDEVAPAATADTNLSPAANAKADKNAPPPTFVATDSVTDYVASPKDNRAFTYEQEVRVPQTEAEAVNRDHAIARLEGLEQGIWSYRGPAQSAPNTEYRVDQRPLDQGTQPAPAVAYYPAYQQDSYGTYPATPYTTASYAAPTYASYGVIYPVQYYPSYSYGYGSHYSTGYVYPGTRFGVGVSISAGVRSSYGYAPGWSVRRGGVTHYPTYQRNYPTHHSGGDGHHRGGRR